MSNNHNSVYRIDNNGNRYPVRLGNSHSHQTQQTQNTNTRKATNNIDKYYIAPPQPPQPPKTQTPKIQTPKIQTPQLQTPKLQTPKMQTPKTQTPQLQTPKIQTPPQSKSQSQQSQQSQQSKSKSQTQSQSQKLQSPQNEPQEKKKMTKDEYRIKNYKPRYNYTKTEQSKQDLISNDDKELELRFNGFIQIKEEDYRCMQPNTYIRYLKDGYLYRAGGKLVLNKWPKYWLLESVDGKKIRWSVPLKDTKNAYFQKDPEIARNKKKEEKARQRFHEALQRGEYVALTKEEYEKLLMAAGKLNHKGFVKEIDYNSEINSYGDDSYGGEDGSEGSEGSEWSHNVSEGNEDSEKYNKKDKFRQRESSESSLESSVDVRLTKQPLKKKYI